MKGNNVKIYRLAKGWSQARLSQEVGVDGSTISRIERELTETVKDDLKWKITVALTPEGQRPEDVFWRIWFQGPPPTPVAASSHVIEGR